MLPEPITGLGPDVWRGAAAAELAKKEKKRELLAYLREHPEELRPVSRRLRQQAPI
jgi:hypothetical protein